MLYLPCEGVVGGDGVGVCGVRSVVVVGTVRDGDALMLVERGRLMEDIV